MTRRTGAFGPTLAMAILAGACSGVAPVPPPVAPVQTTDIDQAVARPGPVQQPAYNMEAPLRCEVNWDEQRMIMRLPFHPAEFALSRADRRDDLPRFGVAGFSFTGWPAERVYQRLLEEASIHVVATDGPYEPISAKELRGELSQVMDVIAETAGLYYVYDSQFKRLELRRDARFQLRVPMPKPIVLAVLDALRGAGVRDIVIDWEDRLLTFDGDHAIEDEVRELIAAFSDSAVLVAYDIDIYRAYPTTRNGQLDWQRLRAAFGPDAVKVSVAGTRGQMLVTSPNLNGKTLRRFLRNQAAFTHISEGTVMVPNRWRSRFDVGRCGVDHLIERRLNLLFSAELRDQRLNSELTISNMEGEISRYDIRSRLGEHFLLIGFPTRAVGEDAPVGAETVFLFSPRVVEIVGTGDRTARLAGGDGAAEDAARASAISMRHMAETSQ